MRMAAMTTNHSSPTKGTVVEEAVAQLRRGNWQATILAQKNGQRFENSMHVNATGGM